MSGEAQSAKREAVARAAKLHRAIGGDARVEEMILRFIADRYGAKSLIYLPANVAQAALKRPSDFVHAAKQHCEPELKF